MDSLYSQIPKEKPAELEEKKIVSISERIEQKYAQTNEGAQQEMEETLSNPLSDIYAKQHPD